MVRRKSRRGQRDRLSFRRPPPPMHKSLRVRFAQAPARQEVTPCETTRPTARRARRKRTQPKVRALSIVQVPDPVDQAPLPPRRPHSMGIGASKLQQKWKPKRAQSKNQHEPRRLKEHDECCGRLDSPALQGQTKIAQGQAVRVPRAPTPPWDSAPNNFSAEQQPPKTNPPRRGRNVCRILYEHEPRRLKEHDDRTGPVDPSRREPRTKLAPISLQRLPSDICVTMIRMCRHIPEENTDRSPLCERQGVESQYARSPQRLTYLID
jgi:hypothetical protein